MAASSFEKFLIGDVEKEKQLRDQIESAKAQIASETDPIVLTQLRQKLSGLNDKLNQTLQAAGVIGAGGVPTKAKDVQDLYIDKAYLQGLAKQAGQTRDVALSSAIQQAGKQGQKGFSTGVADIAAGLEQSLQSSDAALSQAVKQERELGYSKATNQLISDYNEITGLSDRERNSIANDIQARLNNANIETEKVKNYMQEIKDLPEPALITAAKALAGMGVKALQAYLSGGTSLVV